MSKNVRHRTPSNSTKIGEIEARAYAGSGKYEHATVEVRIDLARLGEALGWKAIKSKHGKATLQGGAVVVRVVKRHGIT